MLTANQNLDISKKYTTASEVNFKGGMSVLKNIKVPADSVIMSSGAKVAKEAMKWLTASFCSKDKSLVDAAYKACLNSDNNVSEGALNFLKEEYSKQKKSFFGLISKEKLSYQDFGRRFLVIMLDASKNNEQNHSESNIQFLKTVLTDFKSDKPQNYLDVIVKSKDYTGNISLGAGNFFKKFYVEKGDLNKFYDFMTHLYSLPKSEQKFIINQFSTKNSVNTLFKILQLSHGKDNEALLNAVSDDLDNKLESAVVSDLLQKSQKTDGEADLKNYKILRDFVSKDIQKNYLNEIKDKKGIIQDSNISAVSKFAKLMRDKKVSDSQTSRAVCNYVNFLKDKNGVVDKEFSDRLLKILKINNNPEDSDRIIDCIRLLKNKEGKLPEETLSGLNVFHAVKTLTDKYSKAVFDETSIIIKDKNGNIIPEMVPEILDLTKEGFIREIPVILDIVKDDDKLDAALCKSVKNFLKGKDKRYDLAVSLLELKKTLGLLNDDTINKMNEIRSLNIDGDSARILKGITNPDNTLSQKGFEYLISLVKESGIKKEESLASLLKHSKDSSNKFNDNNISFIKRISGFVNDVKAIKNYTQVAKNHEGIVDKAFSNRLIEVLSKNKIPEDYVHIIECINLSKNKHGVIQWDYVNFLTSLLRRTEKSQEARRHATFKSLLNLICDNEGNILNKNVTKVAEMLKEGLLTEIPIIISMSKNNGILDAELCDSIKTLVLNESGDKYETAKSLSNLSKKDGFNKDLFTRLNKITALKIEGNKFKILEGLKNSDETFSQEGFELISVLRNKFHVKDEKGILSYLKLAKDSSGDLRKENIDYIKNIIEIASKNEAVKTYVNVVKLSSGIIDKNYADNLIDILSKNKKPEDYINITDCINLSRDKKGNIQWSYVNSLYNLKINSDESKMGKNFKTFNNILNVVKDSNGIIIPDIINAVNNCQKNGFLYEIPTIITISKDKSQLNKDKYNKIIKILKNTSIEDRYKMSQYIRGQVEKTGTLNNPKIKVIENIQSMNISKNILGITHFLKNPDDSISITGLNLISNLRKTYHHQIESGLVDILKVCRDKSGYMNKKNINAVKELLSINRNIDVTGIIKSTFDRNCEVDDSKYKPIVKLITEHNISDTATINKVINMSRDKGGNIDSGVLNLFVKLLKKGKNPDSYKGIIPAYKALYKYEHVTSLSQLNLRQKRHLMQSLKRYKNDMQSSHFKEILTSKIFPDDESEYCSIMGRLSHSIGISVKRLPKDVESKYYSAMRTLENPKGDFMNRDFDNNPPVLNLKYSLKDFKRDILDLTKNYSYSERTKALDYYGFELKLNNGMVEMSGFPNADKPDGRLASIKDNRVLHLINKLSPYVIQFVSQNTVNVKGSPEMSKALTDIVTAFPEFLTTIGKRQHRTHDYTLDVHCLKVLQDVFKNPEYKTLSHADRRKIQIIALFHDLSKAENSVDKEHPENSAFNVYYLLNKLGMQEKDRLEIYNVIRNHDWLTHYDFSEYASKDFAFKMRGGESLKMILMLSRADLKGVKKHDTYYKMYGGKLHKAGNKVYPYLREIQRTAINLPQTKVPKASELNQHSGIVDKIHTDGITNTVLYLKPNYDLGRAGFKTCRSTDDFNVLVHGLGSKDAASMFQALGVIDSDALLSTSYILYSKGNYRAFRNEGFVLDVPATNIHAAYWRDFGSGYRKTIQGDLYNTYLFRNNPTREYISGQLRQALNLNDKEYIQLFKQIEDMPIEELAKKHPHTAHAYKKLFNDMEVSKRSYGRNYNEVLLSSPKIQGIFCYGKSPGAVSLYLRRYAERNDIPIIVFG